MESESVLTAGLQSVEIMRMSLRCLGQFLKPSGSGTTILSQPGFCFRLGTQRIVNMTVSDWTKNLGHNWQYPCVPLCASGSRCMIYQLYYEYLLTPYAGNRALPVWVTPAQQMQLDMGETIDTFDEVACCILCCSNQLASDLADNPTKSLPFNCADVPGATGAQFPAKFMYPPNALQQFVVPIPAYLCLRRRPDGSEYVSPHLYFEQHFHQALN